MSSFISHINACRSCGTVWHAKKNKDTRGSHAASIFCFYRDEQMYNRIDMTFWASSHTLVRFFGFDVLDNTTIGEMLGTSG